MFDTLFSFKQVECSAETCNCLLSVILSIEFIIFFYFYNTTNYDQKHAFWGKPTTMKKLIFAFAIVCTTFFSISQTNYATDVVQCNVKNQNNPTSWVTYIDNQEFKIEYRFIDCDPSVGFDHEAVILKIENKTSNILDLDWIINIYRENACTTCGFPVEYSRTIRLNPNETLTGTCDRDTNKQLKIFSKYIDASYSKGKHLSGFQLNSLSAIIQ